MGSILFITIVSFYFASVNASLVDKASSFDFYPLSPELTTENKQLVNKIECENDCLNGGSCEFDDYQIAKCSCPPGFFGEHCENEGESCGSGFCHHSSTCLELSLNDDSFVEHMCDCKNAYTKETFYAGEFCQYESTQFCSEPDDPNGRQFCVNGGQCPEESHLPCICPEGFLGPRCAFQVGIDGNDYAQCGLSCQNGGTCQKGAKQEDSDFTNFFDGSKSFDRTSFEHCVCPSGYFGISCEYKMEKCGDGEHVCFHGSTCARNEDEFSCNCFSSELKTAGLFCEYIASSECEQWIDLTNGHRGFCTNGGNCEVDEYGAAICMCPSGYMGQHCEYRVDIHDDPFKSSQQVHKRAGSFSLLDVILITFAVIFGLVLYYVSNSFEDQPGNNVTTVSTSSCKNKVLEKNANADMGKDESGFSVVELL